MLYNMHMSNRIRNKMLGFRVDPLLNDEIIKYCQREDISVSILVRRAVKEYMWARPHKEHQLNGTTTTEAQPSTLDNPAQA